MQQLISEKQARAITGGRKPLVPIEYDRAIQALVACQTLDDAKYFSDKADALAAWAKIYRDDQAGIESKRLKLHAYRRMGQLASQLRPGKRVAFGKPGYAGFQGSEPGPNALLREKGFTREQARHIQAIAKIPDDQFDVSVSSPRPPGPTILARNARCEDPNWLKFQHSFSQLLVSCRALPASDFARSLNPSLYTNLHERICEMIEWLDEFEQQLPKEKSK